MLRTYTSVLRTPQIPPRLTAVFLSALPLGMLSLTVVLGVQEWTGSLRAAGTISGLFSLGNAAGLALQGRLIDRFGPRPVIGPAGGISALCLIGVALSGPSGSPLWLTGALVTGAGLSVPAITAAVRAWLPRALADEGARSTSYALLAVLFQAAIMVGPLLVSVAILLRGPVVAIGVAAVFIAASSLVYLLAGHDPTTLPLQPCTMQRQARRWSPGLVTLLLSGVAAGLAAGITAVAIPGVMTASDLPALAGAAFGAAALGEVAGAVSFGARGWPGTRSRQLPVIQITVGVVAMIIFLASGYPGALVPIMFCRGLVGAPISILMSALLDDVVDDHDVARSYSLLVSTGLVSAAAGNALAGWLAEHLGVTGLLVLPAVLLTAAAGWTGLRRRTLRTG